MTRETVVLGEGIWFANGVALSKDGDYVAVRSMAILAWTIDSCAKPLQLSRSYHSSRSSNRIGHCSLRSCGACASFVVS